MSESARGHCRRALIETVRGPVDATQLGPTLVHEHLRVRREIFAQFPSLFPSTAAVSCAVSAVAAAFDVGIRTICDPTVMGLGRDVRFMQRVAELSNVNVIAATGMYTFGALPKYFVDAPVESLASAFVHDITEGIQETPVKAGVIKVTTGSEGVTPNIEKVLRAAAVASLATGAPIVTHSVPGNRSGIRQQDVFSEEGVDLRQVLIGHCGDTTDLGYLAEVASRGSFLGMDRYAAVGEPSFEARNRTVQVLCERGYSRQILLSHDAVCVDDPAAQDEVWLAQALTKISKEVLPALVALGVSRATVGEIIVDNPRRWLAGEVPLGA